jgi:hypothetical protein
LFAEAQARGGNAIIAMRFDTTELGANWSEICAYGTAVVAVPVTEAAKHTATQLGYGRPAAQQGPPPQGTPPPGPPPAGPPPAGSQPWGQTQYSGPPQHPTEQQSSRPDGPPQP